MKCVKCGHELAEGAKFCMYCGTKVEQEKAQEPEMKQKENRCPKCGRIAAPGDRFCMHCGSPLPGSDAAVESPKPESNAEAEAQKPEADAAAESPKTESDAAAESGKPSEPQHTDVQQGGPQHTNAQQGPQPSGPQHTNAQQGPQPSGPQQGGPQYSNAQQGLPQNPYMQYGGQKNKKNVFDKIKEKLSAKMIGGICAAAAAVIVLIVVMTISAHTINLNKYLSVTYSGGNTKGSAEVTFDESAFKKDCAKKIKINRKKLRAYAYGSDTLADLGADILSYSSSGAVSALESACISGELSETDNLSNGDKITYEWNTDDVTAKEIFGVRLKHSDKTFTVKGLPDLQKIDLFDGVTVKFSGNDGNGEAEIEADNAYGNDFGISYQLDTSSGLSEGDTVTVTAYSNGFSDVNEALAEKGYITDETEKEYTVSGLSTYISSAADVPSDTLEEIKKQTEDLITSDIAQDDEITVLGKTYLGNYFLTAKSKDSDPQNIIAPVYSISVRVPVNDSGTQDFTYYTCGIFTNLLKSGDAINYDLSDGRLVSNTYRFTTDGHFFSVDGYETLDLLKNAVINQNASEYSAEENGNG